MGDRQWTTSWWTAGGGTPGLAPDLENIMRPFMEKYNIRYAQLAIGRGGTECQGMFTWSDQNRVTGLSDVFMLASVSKAFVCAAITELFPDEDTRLNTMVFPYLGYSGTPVDPRINNVNIQMLVDHTGGFGDNTYNARAIATNLNHNVKSAQDMVDYLWTQELKYTPYNDPNHTFVPSQYSNDGYLILSQVVAKASGMSYLEYLIENITGPMKLNVIPVPTQMQFYPAELIPGESYLEGYPSYDYQDTTTEVNDVDGGDGMVKEACHGPCCLACNASDLVNFIAKFAVWGLGGRTLAQRDGSTPGASAMICSSNSAPFPYDVSVVLNGREDSSGNKIDIDDELYTPIINFLNANYNG